MGFVTDGQTLDDLKILGRGDHTVINLFDRTVTRGGAELLEDMFRYPLPDAEAINRRAAMIGDLATAQTVFPFRPELFDAIEQYLSNTDERTRLAPEDQSLGKKLTGLIAEDVEYKNIYKGVTAVIEVLHAFRDFVNVIEGAKTYETEKNAIVSLLLLPAFEPLMKERVGSKLSYNRVAAYDVLLRWRQRDEVKKILRHVYYLDVYLTVAGVARQRGFVFARALDGDGLLRLEGVYHPHLKKAVANSLYMDRDSNLIFLTGANMAGKSTFMKALGIALFLAHMGFPVPAGRMEFRVFDGIFTTINLPDNLGMGASHFYAEVLRVKKLAKELGGGKRLFIILDELFRGTNVKDACEATIAVTGAFAQHRNSMFLISSHIMEAGEVLRASVGNILFAYLPTVMEGVTPKYTYVLKEGITADRHGMVIVQNEGIIDILRQGNKKKNVS
ncbi:MAG: DNA mismatch repair protein [Chitinophagaceae bacterium]|nr:DNA mismatch repair protein [Chitinophagaceae bacterium]